MFRFLDGELESAPPYPEHYFSDQAIEIAGEFIERSEKAMSDGHAVPGFPEKDLEPHVENTWGDTGEAIVSNWLGLVGQLANPDRKLQFTRGINIDDPLQLNSSDPG